MDEKCYLSLRIGDILRNLIDGFVAEMMKHEKLCGDCKIKTKCYNELSEMLLTKLNSMTIPN